MTTSICNQPAILGFRLHDLITGGDRAVEVAAGYEKAWADFGMGLIPGAGGTVSIPRRIGRWRTLHLALTGAVLDTPTALAWGLVDHVEPVTGPRIAAG